MMSTQTASRIAFDRILLATDFTSASDKALEYALSLARYYDSKLVVAHIVPPVVISRDGEDWFSKTDLQRQANEQMKALSKDLEDKGISFQTRIEEGPTRKHLVDTAERTKADLIVMGTHGLLKVDKFMLGSMAEAVLRSTSRPVLTVGPNVTRRPQYELRFKNIILATELPPASDRAARYAFSLGQEHQAHITLVHVLAPNIYLDADVYRVMDEFKKELQELVPSDSCTWCEPECVLEYGLSADAILSLASERGADLIVMGARKAPALLSHFRAGVAYKVIANASCPVLTIGPTNDVIDKNASLRWS